jgi:hypothetical protein
MRKLLVAAVLLTLPALALAEATVEQKTQFQLAGAAGKVVNFFSKTAREGLTTTTFVKGDRKLERSADSGELIDLAEEKVYTIDFGGKSYTVETFEQIRQRMREAMEKAREGAGKGQGKGQDKAEEQPPEYEVDFDVNETGNKQTIAGFDCREVVATVVVRKKGMKLEEGGGAVLTSNMWLGPKIAALDEEAAFDLRYAKALRLQEMMDQQQMQALAAAFATNPALQEAMKKFRERKIDMKGSSVKTVMSLEAVADPRQGATSGEESAAGGNEASKGIGNMLGKLGTTFGKKKSKEGAEAKPATPGRSQVFTTTGELVRAVPEAEAADVTIPANFKQKKS